MDGIHKSIFLWGLVCLLGFGAYHFPSFMGIIQPMPFWSILTVVGIAGMVMWVPNWKKNKVVHVWLGVGVLGMLYHWAFVLQYLPPVLASPWAYWALLMSIGFVLTAHYWKDAFWNYVGALNFLAFLGFMFLVPTIGMMNQSIILAIVSGIPTMYHGWTGK